MLVHIRDRFVEQQYVRVPEPGARDRDPLPFAARERLGRLRGNRFEPGPLDGGRNAVLALGAAEVSIQREIQVGDNAAIEHIGMLMQIDRRSPQMVPDFLEGAVAHAEIHDTRVGRLQPGKNSEQCALAGAVVAKQQHAAAASDLQIRIHEDLLVAKAHADAGEVKMCVLHKPDQPVI